MMDRSSVRRLIDSMAAGWMHRDVEAIVALFAPDGVFVSPGRAARGHAEIGALVRTCFGQVKQVRVKITRVLIEEHRGAVEWVWEELGPGGEAWRTIEDVIVFELRGGKLLYWREYFDPAQTRPQSLPDNK